MEILSSLTSFEAVSGYYVFSFLCVVAATFVSIRSLTREVYIHHRIAIISVGVFIFCSNAFLGATISRQLTQVPKISDVTPAGHSILSVFRPEIVVNFETPVSFSALHIYSYPEKDLEITPEYYLHGTLPFGRSVRIKPKSNFPPGETVSIYLANIEGPLTHGYGGEQNIPYTSESLPVLTSVTSPVTMTNIPVRQKFSFTTDKSFEEYSLWKVSITPEIYANVSLSGNILSVEPATDLDQGATYTMKLTQVPQIIRYADRSIESSLTPRDEKVISFTVVKPPYIDAILPKGNAVNPGDPVTIRFAEAMDTDSVEAGLLISPDTERRLTWNTDKTTLVIDHPLLSRDVEHTISLRPGIKTASGGILESPVTHRFTTAGQVKMIQSFPADNSMTASVSGQIVITFNQPISPQSFKDIFSLSPPVKGKLILLTDSIIYTPEKALEPETKYTIHLKSGIQSIYGLPSAETQSISFTTKPNQTVLNIPFFKQQSNFTCNIASARMLLAFRGVQISESDLIAQIGNGGKRGSGNPYKGYVDDYGTYWDAVSKGVSIYRKNRIITNGTLEDITLELQKGNPVMTWGQNGWSDPHDISWTSDDGPYIKAVNGMHSAVIRGFTGPQSNPTTILLNDPWRGQYAITTAEFLRRWGHFNVAMVLD